MHSRTPAAGQDDTQSLTFFERSPQGSAVEACEAFEHRLRYALAGAHLGKNGGRNAQAAVRCHVLEHVERKRVGG